MANGAYLAVFQKRRRAFRHGTCLALDESRVFARSLNQRAAPGAASVADQWALKNNAISGAPFQRSAVRLRLTETIQCNEAMGVVMRGIGNPLFRPSRAVLRSHISTARTN
jgi:hypothetical protein